MKTPFNIPTDKWLHFVIGLMVFGASTIFFGHIVGIIITVVVAFLKEFNDGLKWIPFLLTSKGKTTFSLSDLRATIVLPLIIAAIINYYLV